MDMYSVKITDDSNKVGAELEAVVKKALTLCGEAVPACARSDPIVRLFPLPMK